MSAFGSFRDRLMKLPAENFPFVYFLRNVAVCVKIILQIMILNYIKEVSSCVKFKHHRSQR